MSALTTQQLLAQMRRFAEEHGVPIIRADVEDWLRQFIQAAAPRNVLEIGTAIGYSTLVMADALDGTGKIISFERDGARHAKAVEFVNQAPCSDAIRLIGADVAAPGVLPQETFDFVFLDGAKGQYLAILELLLPYLRPGAVIVADNTGFRGLVDDPAAVIPRRYRTLVNRLRHYRQWVFAAPGFVSEDVAIGDGVTVTRYGGRNECNA